MKERDVFFVKVIFLDWICFVVKVYNNENNLMLLINIFIFIFKKYRNLFYDIYVYNNIFYWFKVVFVYFDDWILY